MAKELRKFFDPSTGRNWLVNIRTRIVRDRDGEFADAADAARILAAVERRANESIVRRERDEIMRDMGLTKVRGAFGTFWE